MIDPATHAAVDLAKAQANRQGLDVWETMDRYGLLLTHERLRETQISALDFLRDRLEDISVTQLGTLSGDQTPAGIKAAILQFIDLQKKTLQ